MSGSLLFDWYHFRVSVLMTSIGTAASRKTVRGIVLLACMQACWSPAVADPLYDTAPILTSPRLFAQARANRR